MASYYEAAERALPRNCSSDWVAVTKYVDGVLAGNDTTEQISVKRALYVARKSGPGGNTTLVPQLSDGDVLAMSSSNLSKVLMDPLIGFQVSKGFAVILGWCSSRSRGMGYELSYRSATAWRLATSRLTPRQKVSLLLRVSILHLTRL